MTVVRFRCAGCKKDYEVPYKADLDLSFNCVNCNTPLTVKVCLLEERDELAAE